MRWLSKFIPSSWRGAASRAGARSEQPESGLTPPSNPTGIIEGSTEQTHLPVSPELRQKILRLRALDVTLPLEGSRESDVVAKLWGVLRDGQAFPFTQVEQYLIASTLDELGKRPDAEIRGRRILVGEASRMELLKARDLPSFVRALTRGYRGFQAIAVEFDSTAIANQSFRGEVFDNDRLRAMCAQRSASVGGEPNLGSRFDLLKMMAAAFEDLGAPVNLGIIRVLNPFIPDLGRCPADRRQAILRQILEDSFPYCRDNIAKWRDEIGSAMA